MRLPPGTSGRDPNAGWRTYGPCTAYVSRSNPSENKANMSDIQRLKAQLYQLMTEAQQGAGSLGGFRQKFGQTSAQIQALIAGSATGADRDITELLDAACRSLEQAADSLQIAAQACRSYADQI